MADVEEVEVVVAHHERATLRVGDVFLKIDADQTRTDVEVEAMAMAPIPTPAVLWRKPPGCPRQGRLRRRYAINAAKLGSRRVGQDLCRRGEGVDSGAGAGEEAQPCPFGQFG